MSLLPNGERKQSMSSKTEHVLDSSAVLAVIVDEPGQELVKPLLDSATITAVNACEVVSKLISRGMDTNEAIASVIEMNIEIIAFDDRLAFEAAAILPTTRVLGLSLGDRACIARARLSGAMIVTADKAWKKLGPKLGIEILVIR